MKKAIRSIIGIIILINLVHIYPQGMLIKLNGNAVENPILVDKTIKEYTEFININVEIPQIIGLSNKNGEKVINKEILDWTTMWIKDTKDVSEDFKPTVPYEMKANYSLTNDKKILSFYIDYYQFSGGAHGITTRKTYNVSIDKGEKLQLKDLFDKGYDYKKFINEEIQKEINKHPDYYFTGKEGFQGIKDNQSFYIKDGNLIIHFPYYEIAPYAFGMPEFEINTDLKL